MYLKCTFFSSDSDDNDHVEKKRKKKFVLCYVEVLRLDIKYLNLLAPPHLRNIDNFFSLSQKKKKKKMPLISLILHSS